jgi:lipoyl(octanoyl) transferase
VTQLHIEEVAFAPNPLDYEQGWALQREVHRNVVANTQPQTVLLLEHAPVYTAGRRTEAADRPMDGTRVVDVDRGGMITWHGPGQLIGYPILRLSDPVDVVAYVRRIEDMLIAVCAHFGVVGERVDGRSGVWVHHPDGYRKVAAIGIRVAQGVTMHGFALNCDCDLRWFDRIVPCGIRDATVTTLSLEADRPISVADALPVVRDEVRRLIA